MGPRINLVSLLPGVWGGHSVPTYLPFIHSFIHSAHRDGALPFQGPMLCARGERCPVANHPTLSAQSKSPPSFQLRRGQGTRPDPPNVDRAFPLQGSALLPSCVLGLSAWFEGKGQVSYTFLDCDMWKHRRMRCRVSCLLERPLHILRGSWAAGSMHREPPNLKSPSFGWQVGHTEY